MAGYEGDRERVVVGRTGTEARLEGNTEEKNGVRITVVVERPPTHCLISVEPEEGLLE